MPTEAPISKHYSRVYLADCAHGGDPNSLHGGPFIEGGALAPGANQVEVVLHEGDLNIPVTQIGYAKEKARGWDTGFVVDADSPDRQVTINLSSIRKLPKSDQLHIGNFLVGRHAGAVSCFAPARQWGFWMKVETVIPGVATYYQVLGHLRPSHNFQWGEVIKGSLTCDLVVPAWVRDYSYTNWNNGFIYVG